MIQKNPNEEIKKMLDETSLEQIKFMDGPKVRLDAATAGLYQFPSGNLLLITKDRGSKHPDEYSLLLQNDSNTSMTEMVSLKDINQESLDRIRRILPEAIEKGERREDDIKNIIIMMKAFEGDMRFSHNGPRVEYDMEGLHRSGYVEKMYSTDPESRILNSGDIMIQTANTDGTKASLWLLSLPDESLHEIGRYARKVNMNAHLARIDREKTIREIRNDLSICGGKILFDDPEDGEKLSPKIEWIAGIDRKTGFLESMELDCNDICMHTTEEDSFTKCIISIQDVATDSLGAIAVNAIEEVEKKKKREERAKSIHL